MEKSCRVQGRRVTRRAQQPWVSQPFQFIRYLTKNVANRLHEKQEVGSTRRVTCLSEPHFQPV